MTSIPRTVLCDALHVIDNHIRNNGYPPSRRELSAAMQRQSPASGALLISRLEEEGLVQVDRHKPRAMRITRAGMKALKETF